MFVAERNGGTFPVRFRHFGRGGVCLPRAMYQLKADRKAAAMLPPVRLTPLLRGEYAESQPQTLPGYVM
jgi:hypothetical protein